VPVGVAEALVDPPEEVVRKLGEKAFLLHRAERARVLGEEDVGRARVALLGDRRGELRAVAEAHLDVGARLLLEHLEERLDDLLLAARVDGQGPAVPISGGRLVAVVATAGGSRQERKSSEPRGDHRFPWHKTSL
jgi:hypothetical protein